MKISVFLLLLLVFNSSRAQNMSWEWAEGIINGGHYDSNPFAIDSNGNTFIGGICGGNLIISNNDTILRVGQGDFFITKFDSKGSFLWVKAFGITEYNAIYDILIDKDNNIIATGFFTDTINFNGLGLKARSKSSAFYAKFTNDCEPIWVKDVYHVDTLTHGYPVPKLRSTKLGPNGEMYTCGYLWYPTIFGDTIVSPPEYDVDFRKKYTFVAKLDNEANLIWISPIGTISTNRELGPVLNIAIGANKSIAITGIFYDTLRFGNISLASIYRDDAFIVCFDSNGTPTWGKYIGSLGAEDEGENIAIDKHGNIIAVGIFFDSVGVDGVSLLARRRYTPGGSFPNEGDENSYIIKYNSAGELQWAKSIFGHYNTAKGLALDPSGDIYISGQLSDTSIFVDSTIAFESNTIHNYIAKLDSAGDLKWLAASNKLYDKYYGNESIILLNRSVYTMGYFEYRFPYLNVPGMLDKRGIFVAKLSEATTSVSNKFIPGKLSPYPNPSSGYTTINYTLPTSSSVTITLHDILGREVLRREMGVQSEGEHEESLDVSELPIGSYIVKISTNQEVFTSRISVVR